MTSYLNTINELIHILQGNELPYDHTIIIGNNSSGKSALLKSLLSKNISGKWYLIDSVNRYFNVGQVFVIEGGFSTTLIQFSEKILEHRLMEDNYNLKDTFYYMGVPTSIENFYFDFSREINRLFSLFLGVELEIRRSEVGYAVFLDGIESELSSGYQALIRIFMEMEYVKRTLENGFIIIDEVDEFLFSYNSGRIFEFLRKEYKNFSFIVTTHSADLIANAKEANIVLLSDGMYELMDAGDFNSVSQVYNIFDSISQNEKNIDDKEKIDISLRRLLNNKVAGIWKDENQNELACIKDMNLTKVQKVMIRQIEEW